MSHNNREVIVQSAQYKEPHHTTKVGCCHIIFNQTMRKLCCTGAFPRSKFRRSGNIANKQYNFIKPNLQFSHSLTLKHSDAKIRKLTIAIAVIPLNLTGAYLFPTEFSQLLLAMTLLLICNCHRLIVTLLLAGGFTTNFPNANIMQVSPLQWIDAFE